MDTSTPCDIRVLWFVNQALPAVSERLGLHTSHRGGWLTALEQALRETDVRLAVACDAPRAVPPFIADGTTYYTVAPTADAPWARARRAAEARAYCSPDPAQYDAIVRDFAPDLIHVHGTEGAFGLGIPHWPVPAVLSIQGVLSSLAGLEKRGRDRDAWLSMSLPALAKDTGGAHATRRLSRLARRERAIINSCRSFMGRTRFDHDFLLALKPSFAYYHCDELLRPPFLESKWHGTRNAPRVIACGGGDYARKGLGTALEALALLRERAKQDVILRIVGGVPVPESAGAVAKRSGRLGLSLYVHMADELDAEGVADELQAADLYIHPSHADNSPNSVCEAMAVGVPMVASATGGIPSLATDGADALLVQDGDPYALAGAVRRVLEDDSLAKRLSESARARARARHEPRRIVRQVLDAYGAILAETGRQGERR
jgi:glycosyltransferase involved in cell wall biosynthesis